MGMTQQGGAPPDCSALVDVICDIAVIPIYPAAVHVSNVAGGDGN